jgi:hypothetical protein
MRFTLDPQTTYNERQFFTVVDALAETGGFASIIFVIFSLFIEGIPKSLFYRSILSKIFMT